VNQLEMLGTTLNTSLDSFLNSASVDKTMKGDEAKLANVMELYLKRMKMYFDAEVRMVGFLRERAISLEQKVPSLEIEIQECTAMGMTKNVYEMTKNLNEMVQNVSDDQNIADALRREAVQMRQDLMERSEQYLDMVNKNELNSNDFASHISVLDMIRQNAIQMELPETSRYRALMDNVVEISSSSTITSAPITSAPITPADSAPSTAPEVATNGDGCINNGTSNPVYSEASKSLESNTTTISNENNKVERPAHVIVGSVEKIVAAGNNGVAAPAPAPAKSGWGQVGKPKGPSKSLLDIQKEELSMK